MIRLGIPTSLASAVARAGGVKSDRLVVISEGVVVVAFARASVTSIPKGESAFGIKSDRLVKIGNGLIYIAPRFLKA